MNHFATYPQYWVNHLGFQLRGASNRAFAEAGLDASPEEWSVMLILEGEGPLTPSRLADLTLRDRPAVSRLLAKLDKKGLVSRAIGTADRRSQVIQMTDTGRAAFETWRQALMPVIRRSMADVSTAEIDVIVRVLARMSRNLDDFGLDQDQDQDQGRDLGRDLDRGQDAGGNTGNHPGNGGPDRRDGAESK